MERGQGGGLPKRHHVTEARTTSMLRRALVLALLPASALAALPGQDGKTAGAYSRVEERQADAELRTPTYLIRITENCPEGEVGCRDVRYEGKNIKTGSSIALRGQAVMRVCADRVTPCSHEGYRFRSGAVEYRVTPDGLLRVTQGAKVLVEEQGRWQTAGARQPAWPDPTVQGAGLRLPSDYASARARLVRMTWKPVSSWGMSGVEKQLTYKQYPEVLCGQGRDAVCTGRFENAGEAVLLTIDPKTSKLQVTSIDRD